MSNVETSQTELGLSWRDRLSENLPPRRMLRMASQDISSLLVDRLGVLQPEEAANLVQDTRITYLPGQTFWTLLRYVDRVEESDLASAGMSYEWFLENRRKLRAVKTAEGVYRELTSGGFADSVTRKANVRMDPPPLLPLLIVPFSSEAAAGFYVFSAAEYLTNFPKVLYHEMVHLLESQEFSRVVGRGVSESFTRHLTHQIMISGDSQMARYMQKQIRLKEKFHLAKINSGSAPILHEELSAELGDLEALKQMARFYTSTDFNDIENLVYLLKHHRLVDAYEIANISQRLAQN